MAASTENSSSWMSLCMAASSKFMDEKHIIQSDATTDPDSEDSAVASLMCFESMGGDSTDSSVTNHCKDAKQRKGSGTHLAVKKKGRGPSKYIRGIPAIRYVRDETSQLSPKSASTHISFDYSKRDAAWNVMFRRLQEFRYEHKHW